MGGGRGHHFFELPKPKVCAGTPGLPRAHRRELAMRHELSPRLQNHNAVCAELLRQKTAAQKQLLEYGARYGVVHPQSDKLCNSPGSGASPKPTTL